MARSHVAIIDPGCRVAELDSFNRLQDLTTSKLTYHLPCIFGMDSLYQLEHEIHGVIIFGSGASVHDSIDWLKNLTSWIESQIDRYTPMLGLCFGHQLLAHMLGSKVAFVNSDKSKLCGLRKISFLDRNGFWQSQKSGLFIVSHRETVTELSPSCEVFATSEEIAIDGFRHKNRPIWGMQCHPEAGLGFIENQKLDIPIHQSSFYSGQQFLRGFFKLIEQKTKEE